MSDTGHWMDDPEKARVSNHQLPIFPRDAASVCRELGLAMEDAVTLYEDGLLEFDPRATGCLDEACEAELRFLGTLARTLPSAQEVRHFVAGLSQPFCYDAHRIYFDWPARRWRLLPGEDDPEECFFHLVRRLGARSERGVLLALRGWIDDALDLARTRALALAHEEQAVRSSADCQ